MGPGLFRREARHGAEERCDRRRHHGRPDRLQFPNLSRSITVRCLARSAARNGEFGRNIVSKALVQKGEHL